MTKLNKNQAIIILIAIMIVATLFGMVTNEFLGAKVQEVSAATVGTPISTEEELVTFLNAAGSNSDKKYGYLTNDITYTKKLSGRKLKYHYLDGNGYTITLTDTKGRYNGTDPYILGKESGMSIASQSITNSWDVNANQPNSGNYNDYAYVNNSDYPGYSNKEMPFGYPSSNSKYQEFYASGYFGGLGENCEFKDLKVNFNGSIYHDQDRTRGMALGLLFGTTSNVTFDNVSLIINGNVYFRFKQDESIDTEGVGTLCLGGFVGFAHKGTVVKNSYIELNAYITGVTSGRKSGVFERGYLRTFVGGVAGALLNGSKVYNLTCAGGGSLRATEEGSAKDSKKNKIGFSGLVAGTTLGGDKQLYNPANVGTASYKNNVTDGIIDGVISSWTGMAFYHTNGTTGPNYTGISIRDNNRSDDHYYVGCLVGATSAGTTKNISYTFNDSQTEAIKKDRYVKVKNSDGLHTGADYDAIVATDAGTFDSLAFKAAGYYGSKDALCPSNKLSIRMRDNSVEGGYKGVIGTYNSSTASFVNPIDVNAVGLRWSDTTETAKLLLIADMNVLYPNTDAFLWKVKIAGTGLTNQEITTYNLAHSIQEIKDNYVDAQIQLFNMRDLTGATATIDIDYGYAVKYRFNEADDNSVQLKEPDIYDANNDRLASVPLTMELVVPTESGDVPLTMTNDDVNPNIKKIGEKVILDNQDPEFRTDTWKVYKNGTYVEEALTSIRDAGTYEIVVSNGTYESEFDLFSEADRIVAYKVDNNYYVEAGLKWQQKYTYSILKKDLTGAWNAVTNTFDNESYTTPQSFNYCGADINFTYDKVEESLLGSDVGNSQTKYWQLIYTEREASQLLEGETYYKKVNNDYVLLGTISDATFENGLEKYYIRREVQVGSIRNVGKYAVEVCEFSNPNYNLVNTGASWYEISVNPRELEIKFRDLHDYHYDGETHRANYMVVEKAGGQIHVNPYNVTEDVANIVIYNAFESESVEVIYTPGNNYINKGIYTIQIKLASGFAEENYLLPADETKIVSLNGEDFGTTVVVNVDSQTNLVTSIIRNIEIGDARPFIVREHNGGAYNDENMIEYATYETIATENSSLYPVKTVQIDGVTYSAYFEQEPYFGANSVPAMMLGVKRINDRNQEYWTKIYVAATYYKATLEDNVYVADMTTSYNIISTVGTYVAVITPKNAYKDYEKIKGYFVYEVTPITADVSMSLTEQDAPTQMAYTGEDLTDNFKNFAKMSGLSKVDEFVRGYGLKFDYYVEDAEYIEADAYTFNSKTYRPVEMVKDAGNYLAIANNNLPELNYAVNYDATCTQLVDNKPYHTFEITKKDINVKVLGITKTYATEYTQDIQYEITNGEIAQADIDAPDAEIKKLVIKFTSEGANAGADVIDGGYVFVSDITGTSARNYNFIIDDTERFVVEPLLLRYAAGNNWAKNYGETFDATQINVNPLENQIYVNGEVVDDVRPVYASEGFVESAVVGKYSITATLEGTKAANYTIEVGGQITVNKKRLTLSANSVVAVDNLVYDATEKGVTVMFDGARAEDTVIAKVVYNRTPDLLPINVGTYQAIVVDIDDASKANYTFDRTGSVDCEFAITARPVSVNVKDFTMGYGDTSLSITGEGFDYSQDSLQFIAEDAIEFTYTTLDPATMKESAGDKIGVVQLVISGDKAANYALTHESYGNLTITTKDMSTAKLVNSTLPYSGANLIEQIKLDTTGEGFTIVVKFEGEEVQEVVNVGTYSVEITGDGVNYAGTTTIDFVVDKGVKGADYLSASDLEVRYNKVIVKGKAVGSTILVSESGEDGTWVESDTLIFTDIAQTKKAVYIKLAEDENYYESEVMKINVELTYNPENINTVLNSFSDKFTFKDIEKYNDMLEDYEKIAQADRELVNAEKFNAVKTSYEKLINATKTVVASAQQAASKAGRMGLKVVTTSALASATLIVGLGLLIRKKKNDQEEV